MTPKKIKELREKFFDECTNANERGIDLPRVNSAPHDVFQWFVDNFREEDVVIFFEDDNVFPQKHIKKVKRFK